MGPEIGTSFAIVVGLLFLEWLPRQRGILQPGTLRIISRTIGIHIILVAVAFLCAEIGAITWEESASIWRFGVTAMGAVVLIFAGSDVYTWWYLRHHEN